MRLHECLIIEARPACKMLRSEVCDSLSTMIHNQWKCTRAGSLNSPQGKELKYVLVPPGYKGELPRGYDYYAEFTTPLVRAPAHIEKVSRENDND